MRCQASPSPECTVASIHCLKERSYIHQSSLFFSNGETLWRLLADRLATVRRSVNVSTHGKIQAVSEVPEADQSLPSWLFFARIQMPVSLSSFALHFKALDIILAEQAVLFPVHLRTLSPPLFS